MIIRKQQNEVEIFSLSKKEGKGGRKILLSLVFTAVMLVFALSSRAQFYSGSQMTFGKNRVQYNDNRVWKYFRFRNFDTYYYSKGKALAIYTSTYAAREIKRISKFLDFEPDGKIKFLVFNDLSDLKETNIGLITGEEYNIGGLTHVINNKVFIYFTGDHRELDKQISAGISRVFLNQIMFGGSVGSRVKNSILLSLPSWFTDGFVSFMTEDWNTDIDTKVRDGFLSGRFNDFRKLNRDEQTVAGHSIWKYIEDKYGRRAVSDVLFMAKINRSVESGFIYVLGVSYNGFMEEWKNWYLMRYNAERNFDFKVPSDPYFKHVSRKKHYTQARLSADGRYLAYAENQIGKVKIKIVDLASGKKKSIEKFGYKLDEKVDYSYPVLAWAPKAHFLAYVMEEKDKTVLKFYDLDTHKKKIRYLNNFSKILSISYNPRGNLLVMSAVQKGQSDIYVYNIGANSYKRITYDLYDDEQPVFVNGGTAVIFASNRPDDTLKFDVETGKNITRDTVRGMKNRDIFFYDLRKKGTLLKRVTDTKDADEKQPQYLAYNRFTWLTNQTGIYNRRIGKLDSTISYIDTIVHYKHIAKSYQVSNYLYNISEQNAVPSAGKFVEIIPMKGKDLFFIRELPDFEDFEKLKPVYTTYRLTTFYHPAKKQKPAQVKEKSIAIKPLSADSSSHNDSLASKAVKAPADSSSAPTKPAPQKKKFKVIYIGQNTEVNSDINIDNYNLEGGTGKKSSSKQKNIYVLEKAEKKKKEKHYTSEQLFRPLNYETQFSLNKVVTQMDFSYMNLSYQPFRNYGTPVYNNQGFAAFMKFGVIDLLEDYRLTAGINLSPTFRDNEYMVSFSNLKKRLDKEYTFHRMVMSGQYEYAVIKDYVHEVFLKYSWPFDNVRSFRTTFNYRNDYQVVKSVNHNTLVYPSSSRDRAGVKLEYVFDNTRNPALNVLFGTRYKLFAEYYQPLGDLRQNTFIVGLDFRKYIPISKNFIWANRMAASSSFGTEKLIYYLGGVDNWMFPVFNKNIQVDQNQNYVYQTLATNMRGFDQNIRNGNNFFVINSELRLRLFSFLSARPIKSSFLSNFMVIGFGDVGTAWTGPNPFSDENSLFRQEFYRKPIKVIVINQNDPIVGGYGIGVRSQVFGYYVRADWAWGLTNGYRTKVKFYLSLSLDF